MPKQSMITRGAILLRKFLEAEGMPLRVFCKKHGLEYTDVHRKLSGQRSKRVPVDFAKSILLATNGAVPWDAWASDTAVVEVRATRVAQYLGAGSTPAAVNP